MNIYNFHKKHLQTIIYIIILIAIIFVGIFYNKPQKECFKLQYIIPKTIVQTYKNKEKIPKKVYDNIKKFAPDYKHIIFNDQECITFIEKNFDKNVSNIFQKMSGPHRADLFRYCYLYIFGGFYMDIKIELIRPMHEIHQLLKKYNTKMSSVLSINEKTIFQGFIGTVPKNPIFLELIDFVVNNYTNLDNDYLLLTKDFYTKLQKRISMKEGINNDIFLFTEECGKDKSKCYDGLDRYGFCCFITYNKENFIKTRYSDYPWE